MRLRDENGWTQDTLARRLGVSRRTLSNWENGYWLPPFSSRVQVVVSLSDQAPEYVLAIADGLAVSVDPAVEPLLKRHRDALYGDPSAPEPSPARPRPAPDALRAAMDALVREAADAMNVAANDVRAAFARALAVCAEMGATLDDAQAAVAPKQAKNKRTG